MQWEFHISSRVNTAGCIRQYAWQQYKFSDVATIAGQFVLCGIFNFVAGIYREFVG